MKITITKKGIITLMMLCFAGVNAFAQPQLIWSTQASRLGTVESQTVLVACNGLIYEGIGNSNTNSWQVYDPSNNTWTTKTSMPGNGRNQCVGFSIGTKVYVGLGYDGTTPFPNDFYEYETTTDTWTSLGAWPLSDGITGGFAWTINGKGYVGGGTSPNFGMVLYEFDPSGNTWTAKSPSPTYIQYTAAFVLNNKGYYSCGWAGGGANTAETYEYDPSNDTWTQKANAPTAVRQTAGFAVSGFGFVAGGYVYTSSVMQYNPSTDSWSSATSLPDVSHESKATNIGNIAYLIQNRNSSATTNVFYKAEVCNFPSTPTLSAGSTSLCSGSSTTLSIASGTLNDATGWQWYTGACGGTSAGSGTSINVTPSSSTIYSARGTGGCASNANCGSVIVNVLSASISGTTSICQGVSSNLTITCNGTGPFSGTLSDGTAWSGNTSPITVSVSPLTTTTYTISTFIANGSACPSAISGNSATITVTGQAPSTTGDSRTGAGVVNLSASGSGTLDWYDDPTAGNLVNTGSTYSPNLSATQTFYVSNTEGGNGSYTIGRTTPVSGSPSNGARGLIFDVTANATLTSVTVVPVIFPRSGTITLQNSMGSVMAYAPYNFGPADLNGAQVITLNFALTPGTGYKLINSGPGGIGPGAGIFRTESPVIGYPYTSAGSPVSITSSTSGTVPYFFFYNWQISANSQCTSSRTPVTGTINTACPTISLEGNGTAIANGSTSSSTADNTDFGQASAASNASVTFTIQNTGITPLNVGAISFSGANAGDFSVTSPPSSTVAASSSTSFVVTFNPSALGTRTATISIGNDSCTDNPYTFVLSGLGVDRVRHYTAP